MIEIEIDIRKYDRYGPDETHRFAVNDDVARAVEWLCNMYEQLAQTDKKEN